MKSNEFKISIIQLVMVYGIGLIVGGTLMFVSMDKMVIKQTTFYNQQMDDCRKLNDEVNRMLVMDEVEKYLKEGPHNLDDQLVQLMKFGTIVTPEYKLKVDKLIKETLRLKGIRDANKTR